MNTSKRFYLGVNREHMIAYYLQKHPLETIQWAYEVLEVDIETDVCEALSLPETKRMSSLKSIANQVIKLAGSENKA